MVEGHSVHRIAAQHRARLVGKAFSARSPNGRFTDGAKRIDGRKMSRIEALGKNLLVFFGGHKYDGRAPDVMHVHFGMAGAWTLHDAKNAPDSRDTTRLTLDGHGIISHLSAMTCNIGTEDLWEAKRKELGEDPLREDSDPEKLYLRVCESKKTIGQLLMDQGFFPGVGNIYRAEICFCSGVHPNVKGCDLTREQFARVWGYSVSLLRRGFECGSILTVDPEEAIKLGKPKARRYVYAQPNCVRCGTRVQSWDVNTRNCFACPSCQPPPQAQAALNDKAKDSSSKADIKPSQMLVANLRSTLKAMGADTTGNKATLVARLTELTASSEATTADSSATATKFPPLAVPGTSAVSKIISAPQARAEKERAGESRAVEHIAELDTTVEGLVDWTDLEGSARGVGNKKVSRAKRKLELPLGEGGGGGEEGEGGVSERSGKRYGRKAD